MKLVGRITACVNEFLTSHITSFWDLYQYYPDCNRADTTEITSSKPVKRTKIAPRRSEKKFLHTYVYILSCVDKIISVE